MQAILAVTVPFFALVLCGYLAAHRHVLPESAIPGLNTFVLYFALPCLLFRFGSGTPIFDLLNPVVLGVYLIAALLIVFFTIAITLAAPVALKDAAFGALVAAFPNTGFMGVPLLVALLGPGRRRAGDLRRAGRPLRHQFGVHRAGAGGRAVGAWCARRRTARAARRAVEPAALVDRRSARVFSVAGWTLPGPADTVVKMLADAASPVALFTIGAVLHRAGQHVHTRTPPAATCRWPRSSCSLHPLLVFVLAASALAPGRCRSAASRSAVMTLAAALPSASNVSLLAERYGADNGRIARIIMSSTVAAFVSFPLLAWLAGAHS